MYFSLGQGSRFKCVNCKDFDLCAPCESLDFCENAIGPNAGAHSSGVRFTCPFPHCGAARLTEMGLLEHVDAMHARCVSSDMKKTSFCPISF